MMKNIILIGVLAMLLIGCSHASKDSEFSEHKTLYKNWDHAKYSWWGHRNPTPEDLKKSKDQGWWGTETSIEQKEDQFTCEYIYGMEMPVYDGYILLTILQKGENRSGRNSP